MCNLLPPFRAALLLTENCNAECSHCWFDSKKEKTMTLIEAKNYIEKIREIPTISWLSITGGEPFLYPELVENLIKYSNDSGLKTEIVTNCFWAETREKAFKLLNRLKYAGLNVLNISVDDFHQIWVPFEYVKNTYFTCKDLGIEMVIMTTLMKNSHLNLKVISNLIGDNIPIANETDAGIHWAKGIESPFTPVGRGSKISSKKQLYAKETIDGPCNEVLRDLGITTNGDVLPCCSALSMLDKLKLGNLKNQKLSEILKNAYQRPIFKTLYSNGPKYFVKSISPKKYTNKCHLCYDILKRF